MRLTAHLRYVILMICTLSGCAISLAQVPVITGRGGIGDPAEVLGSLASTYALNVDHVNYYTGAVSLQIPMIRVGGRGSAAANLLAPIDRQWWVNNEAPQSWMASSRGGENGHGWIDFFTSSPNSTYCQDSQGFFHGPQATSYFTWNDPSGNAIVLTDAKYAGQPKDPTSWYPTSVCVPANRGRVFRSTDGSGLVFIADTDVLDGEGTLGGTLLMPDGTKYVFVPGNISRIEDRNGNVVQFSWELTSTGGIYLLTDPAGRVTKINYTSVPSLNSQDVITYPGFGDNGLGDTKPRQIKVNYGLLQSVLGSGEILRTYHELFPELGGSSSTLFNPYVTSAVVLADGTSYTMQYNSYGEVTKLTLPTGAYITFKYSEAYSGGSSGAILLSDNVSHRILRSLVERDEYADSVHLSARMLYSAAAGIDGETGRPNLTATAKFEQADGTVLRVETHAFYGNPLSTALPPPDNTYADWWLGMEYRTDVGDASGILQTTQKIFRQRPWGTGENSWFSITDDAQPLHDPQLCQMNTTVQSADGTIKATNGTLYSYDRYNNPTDVYTFDWGHAPAIGTTCSTSTNGFLQHTNASYLAANSVGNYLEPSTNIVGLPEEVKVLDSANNVLSDTKFGYDEMGMTNCPNIVGHDNTNYAGGGMRGNLTSIQQYLNPTNSWVMTSRRSYDIAGNMVAEADANGNTTNYLHTDSFSDGKTRNIYSALSSIKNAMGQVVFTANFDYASGMIVDSTDALGNVATRSYGTTGPALDRPTQVINAKGTALQSRVKYGYNSATDIVVSSDKDTDNDQTLKAQQLYDGLGRPTTTKAYETSTAFIETDTAYDALGRVLSVSNPYRPGDTVARTVYEYDSLGRVSSLTTPDQQVAITKYGVASANDMQVGDQAGKKRRFVNDALGRLTDVYEDPTPGSNLHTSYSYLNNIVTVAQSGQTRQFTRDSMGRLIAAVNPESGTVTYDYDKVGNLVSRKDARGVVTCMGTLSGTTCSTPYKYDSLNRVLGVSYSDSTPGVTYTYEGAANSIGQLTSVTNGVSTTNWTQFDQLGRVTASNQQTSGYTYNFSYGYNLTDALTKETFPSGRVVTMTPDGMNRPYAVSGTLNGSTKTYLSETVYTAFGGVQRMTRGNGVQQSMGYNTRLQPTSIAEQLVTSGGVQPLLSLVPSWTDNGKNNGLLQSLTTTAGGFASTQTFGYDALNRLASAKETQASAQTWMQSFNYDSYGNMWMPSSTLGAPAVGPGAPTSNVYSLSSAGNNRNVNSTYDRAGNLTGFGGATVTYDAENRVTAAGGSSFSYDGLGQRVVKTTAAGSQVFVRDAFGQLTAEYATVLPTLLCATCYPGWDHLGSIRIVTDGSGSVVARHDYAPYGQEIGAGIGSRTGVWGAGDNLAQKFTGYERDTEVGMDFAQARYMSSGLGRFMSPDPGNAGADFTNPQSWNGYAYVLGNPLKYVDPNGESYVCHCGSPLGCGSSDGFDRQPGSGGLGEEDCKALGGEWTQLNDVTTTVTVSADTSQVTSGDLLSFFNYWRSGELPASISYGPKDGMTKLLANSRILSSIRAWYASQGCPVEADNIDSNHFPPFVEGVLRGNRALFQIGGFRTKISTSGNTTTFTITNVVGQASWSGGSSLPLSTSILKASYDLGVVAHMITPGTLAGPFVADGATDNPYGPKGPRHNVTQTFSWSEKSQCGR